MAIDDRFRVEAQDRTNRAWAYREGEDTLDRDQAKWEYAVEQCTGRLRAEAALSTLSEAIIGFVAGTKPVMETMLGALHQAQKILGPEEDAEQQG